jgi:predicted DNA-binding ArsR family transcriptional regulator
MRVKISYTVDLEEVPQKIQTIVDEAVEDAISQLTKTNHTFLTNLIEKGNLQSSIEDLSSLREAMYKTDQQLADCCDLLANLQKTHTLATSEVEDE